MANTFKNASSRQSQRAFSDLHLRWASWRTRIYYRRKLNRRIHKCVRRLRPHHRISSRLQRIPTPTLSDMVEYASKGIVGVSNFKSTGNRFAGSSELSEFGTGSGVIYKIDGEDAYIVTNNHVIEGAGKIEVTLHGGEKETAELIGSDALTDLAVLKINGKHVDTALEFGDSEKLRAGDPVVAIGNPLSLDFSGTVTQGIISAPSRSIDVKTTAGNWEMDVIQTDAAINPGNSGGALLSTDGKVIGINSLKIAENGVEGLGFAIPSNDVVPLLEEMMKNGKIERPYIGVGLADLADVPYTYVQHFRKK